MNNFYLGCDVSKGHADFVIIDNQSKVVEKNFKLDDTPNGHETLYRVLKSFLEKHTDSVLYAAVESTGGYENNWYQTLTSFSHELPIHTGQINPRGLHHHVKASLERTQTDKNSAFFIATYQIKYSDVIHYGQQDQYKSMKRLYKAYRMLVKIQTQLLNEMETLLYTANPDLVRYRKDNTPLWLLRLLEDYPVASDLADASIEDLISIPYLKMQRAEEIIKAAQESVASATDSPTRVIIKTLAKQVLDINHSIRHLEKEAKNFVNVPEIGLLTSIPSIGVMSAVGLYIELGNIANFSTAKKLASFWGLHPLFKESGDGILVPKMSKLGRKMPRAILFMTVLNGIRTHSFISEIYQRELKKGKCKMSAIGVCMHKMARIVFGVLKNATPFDANIDRHNQCRSVAKKKNIVNTSEMRRFQKQDPLAPVSRRQYKKRKGQEQSQSELVTVCEIKIPAPSEFF